MVSGLAESSFKDVPEIFEVTKCSCFGFVIDANYVLASLLAPLAPVSATWHSCRDDFSVSFPYILYL